MISTVLRRITIWSIRIESLQFRCGFDRLRWAVDDRFLDPGCGWSLEHEILDVRLDDPHESPCARSTGRRGELLVPLRQLPRPRLLQREVKVERLPSRVGH